ncbi:hypothetical protein BM28_A0260 [Brucella melitensis M28]|nr:hypothetical protein BM28_A0260 [Brucella melitensis M28]
MAVALSALLQTPCVFILIAGIRPAIVFRQWSRWSKVRIASQCIVPTFALMVVERPRLSRPK